MTKFIHIIKDDTGIHQMESESTTLSQADTNMYDHLGEIGYNWGNVTAYTTLEATDTENIQKVMTKLEGEK